MLVIKVGKFIDVLLGWVSYQRRRIGTKNTNQFLGKTVIFMIFKFKMSYF